MQRLNPMLLLPCLLAAIHCKDGPAGRTGTEAPAQMLVGKPDAGQPAPVPPMPPSTCGGLVGDSLCDPMSGWPCDIAAGDTCEYSNTGGRFQCFPGPNTAGFCGACSSSGPYCGVGFTCNYDDWCERYCCADSDCNVGQCQFDIYGNPEVAAIGYCRGEGIAVCAGSPDAGAPP